MARMAMVISTKRCIGCNTCATACKVANNVPNNIWWNRVFTIGGDNVDTPAGTFGVDNSMGWMPVSCQHCENPACVKACPYTGVRSFNWDEPQHYVDFAVGDAAAVPHRKHVVEKCTFCYQRTSQGKTPACMELCPARARFWGDLDDPESEVSRLLAQNEYTQLLPEMGTEPNVYYLV